MENMLEPTDVMSIESLTYIVENFLDTETYRNITLDWHGRFWICTITVENIGRKANVRYFDEVIPVDGLPDLYQIVVSAESFVDAVDQTRKRLIAIRDAIEKE